MCFDTGYVLLNFPFKCLQALFSRVHVSMSRNVLHINTLFEKYKSILLYLCLQYNTVLNSYLNVCNLKPNKI